MSLATRALRGPTRDTEALRTGGDYYPRFRGHELSVFQRAAVNQSHADVDRLLAMRAQTVDQVGDGLLEITAPHLAHVRGMTEIKAQRPSPYVEIPVSAEAARMMKRGPNPLFYSGYDSGYASTRPDGNPWNRVIRPKD